MKNSLIYPTIDLYLYDLRQGLGQKSDKFTENHDNFLQKIPPELQSKINTNSVKDQEWEREFRQLSNPTQLDFNFSGENANLFEVYYYPVQLSDTYGLMVDCSISDRTSPQPVDIFAKLKNIILEQLLQDQTVTLGQTWLITSQVSPQVQTESDFENLALQCYQSLIGSNTELINKPQIKGKFLEGRFFEWNQPNFNTILSPDNASTIQPQNSHVIVILYPTAEQAQKAADFISGWMRLFCYRHKVIWAYVQSRTVKNLLQTEFTDIQTYIEYFQSKKFKQFNFQELDDKLGEADHLFSSYAINLSYLQFQYRTIEINLYNYQEYLKSFEREVKQRGYRYELNGLMSFYNVGKEKYLRQVRKDWENLSEGLKLLEIAVNLIRANVEVKQAARDRNFQTIIGILGAGLGAASVTSSISGQFPNVVSPVTIIPPEDAKKTVVTSLNIPEPWLMPSVSLLLSIGVGLLVAVVTGLMIWVFGRAKR